MTCALVGEGGEWWGLQGQRRGNGGEIEAGIRVANLRGEKGGEGERYVVARGANREGGAEARNSGGHRADWRAAVRALGWRWG
jgi:hypothetical protein